MDEEDVSSDVENGEENQDEDEEAIAIRPLDQDIIIPGLSLLCRTGNGLRHAFIKVVLKDKRLSDMAAISSYVHLRFMDVSNNRISDLSPLSSLTQLLWLKIDKNYVTCFQGQTFSQLVYLQWLSMAANRLTEVEGLVGLALESLNLSGNRIERLNGLESCLFSKLGTLELRGNRLTSTNGINLPNLERLYLAQNAITSLEGLEKLERLTTLHLRDNKLGTLEGLNANMKCLQYLNVRSNDFLDETCLRALELVSKTLRVLILSENPLDGTTDYRPYVLTLIPKLERLDKEPVSLEERAEVWKTIQELKEETG
ncbi:leucine-rich repeat-containing protein 23 isoform X1 [Corythoichthys intestinalis]|uniref:leucine-rich repeat-containing protein 23 isoform X1 n=1 Tax=Corythoichthys intestinalis TaxID=161448 RepID=UPI0025A58161|nr:leucine-rich repeat-containing protein 23 isoform X1 [Corythoichthys intestinalis]XP_061802887.1 leucine-rich repeat-containing protein 23-like [Nerophis lumbriciformis]